MRIRPNIKALTLAIFLSFYAFAKAQTAQVTISQDTKIPQLLELKNELSNDNELGDHYKIQIYSGNAAQAGTILKRFRNRLEADRALIEIKKEFPNALIFKPDPKR